MILVTGSTGGIGKAVMELVSIANGFNETVLGLDPWADPPVDPGYLVNALYSQPAPGWERLPDDVGLRLSECRHVVVCHGINQLMEDANRNRLARTPNPDIWEANVFSVMNLLDEWVSASYTFSHPMERRTFQVVTSNSAAIPRSRSRDYCGSKAAIDMVLRSAQRDYVKEGFEFYSHAAGHVYTPMFDRMSDVLGRETMEAAAARSPIGRAMTPGELARIIAWVIQEPAAKWLSGSSLRSDGGEH